MAYYTAGEFAKYAGVTSRTLRYYDKIGLLKPSAHTQGGYRLYCEEDMIRLQRIIALRYLKFSIQEIQLTLGKDEVHSIAESLQKQKEAFQKERSHLDHIIQTIERLQKDENYSWKDMTDLIQLIVSDEKIQEQFTELWRQERKDELFRSYGTNPEGWRHFVYRHLQIQEGCRVFEIDSNGGSLWRRNAHQLPGCHITQTVLDQPAYDNLINKMEEVTWANTPSFSYEILPAGKFHLTPDDYDVVVANHLFIRSAEIQHVLEQCRKTLKSGGYFYCTAIGRKCMKELIELVQAFEPTVHFYNTDSLDFFSMESGKTLLEQYFDDVQWHHFQNDLETSDAAGLCDYVWATYSNAREVLAGREKELQKYFQKIIDRNGPICITEVAGVFSARKSK